MFNTSRFSPEDEFNFQKPTFPIEQNDFYENLAGLEFFQSYGEILKEIIDNEINKRAKWYQKIEAGLKALGFGTSVAAPSIKGNQSDIINSTFLRTFLSMTAQFSEELFQPGNMCSVKVKNPKTLQADPNNAENLNKYEQYAELVEEDLNHKLMYGYDDFLVQLERGLQSCFLTGTAIYKVYYDEMLRRPVVRFIQPENILIAPTAPSLNTAEIVTHIFALTRNQVEAYMDAGFFMNVDFLDSPDEMDYAKSVRKRRSQNSGIEEGSVPTNIEDPFTKLYWFGESELLLPSRKVKDPYVALNPFYKPEIKSGFFPYRVISHLSTGKIVTGTRSWKKDNYFEIIRKHSLFQFQFLPGDDFWGMGLHDTAIQLHNNATTIQRELDIALKLSNNPTLFKSADMVIKDSTIDFAPGSVITVETTGMPIADCFARAPFSSPDPLFYQYLKDIENEISSTGGISTQTFETIPSNTDAQVLLAVMDREQKPMSGVLKRIIRGLNQMFESLQTIFVEDMGQNPFGDGTLGINNEEIYGSPIQILSSCNPSLASSSVRIVQMQLIMQYAMQNPELHNMRNLYKELYGALKIENINKILLTEEALQQSEEAAKQQAAQQQQAVQQQQDFTNQQAATQTALMEKDLIIKENKEQTDASLKKLQVLYKYLIDNKKLDIEIVKEKGENVQQQNIELASLYKTYESIRIQLEKLAHESGLKLEITPPPVLKEFDIEEELFKLNQFQDNPPLPTPDIAPSSDVQPGI